MFTLVGPAKIVGRDSSASRTRAMHGESSGCIRVLPDDAVKIWDWLGIDDEVHVVS